MNLRDAFDSKLITYSPDISDKEEVLRRIADMAVSSGRISDITSDALYRALSERESMGSTGFGNGMAIPHCRIPDLDDFLVGMLISENGIDFDSIDGEKTQIFPFIIGPDSKPKEYLKLLSGISQILRDSSFRKEILSLRSPEEIIELIKAHTLPEDGSPPKRPGMKMLHVFIQNEDLFDDLLQVFAGSESTSALILETHESTDYMMKIPLFAGFWNADVRHFNRMIVAVVRDELVNATIRNIEYICGKISERDDIMITVTDLHNVLGSLDF
ncbi:MAG: PTS sugar transporter subunit IIA [Candidatus Aegiribacteria sp.]|nr:PTS sugar transporter subunit IIA [Candidatus Aegiribacteria sp.]